MTTALDILEVALYITCANPDCESYNTRTDTLVCCVNDIESTRNATYSCNCCNTRCEVYKQDDTVFLPIFTRNASDEIAYYVLFHFSQKMLATLHQLVRNFQDGDAPGSETVRPLCDDDLELQDSVSFVYDLFDCNDSVKSRSDLDERNKVAIVCANGVRFQTDVLDPKTNEYQTLDTDIFELNDLFLILSKLPSLVTTLASNDDDEEMLAE